MKFIINGTVVYNSGDGSLRSPDHILDTLTLNRITNELLLLFIKNNSTPLSRDVFLKELWEARGLTASSNNLNNHVSMLRKALAQCGCSDLITTIPKYGFLFEADVKIVSETCKKTPEKFFHQNTESDKLLIPEIVRSGFEFTLTPEKIKYIIFISLLLLMLGVILLLTSFNEKGNMKSMRSELFTVDQCSFYLADDVTRRLDKSEIINTLKIMTKKESVDCNYKTDLYFFHNNGKDASGRTVSFNLLSYCTDADIPCDNYYIFK